MEKKNNISIPKRVLILGNGFDLAHGLPTRYSDFLEFCEKVSKIYTIDRHSYKEIYIERHLDNWEIDEHIKNILSEAFDSRRCKGVVVKTSNEKLDKLYAYIKENTWYDYFSNDLLCKSLRRNWIDFESEIRLCIKYIDENSKYLSKKVEDLFKSSNAIGDENNALIRYSAFKSAVLNVLKEDDDIFKLRSSLYEDLKRLIKALEIYLLIVEDIPIKSKSDDISGVSYDCIINFNYTHIYKLIKRYNAIKAHSGKPTEIFHIHGEIGKEPNNMVLGIDEYWSEDERNSHTNFTIFKKFAQRIQKKTGVDSYKWIKEINDLYEQNIAKNSSNNSAVADIRIFGHSLDVTDKDILKAYLESEATDVTIYCRDEETEGEYIANVIKIIGEKRLLEKVNQYPPKLKFVIQQDMLPFDEEEDEEEEEKELQTV